MLGHGSVHYSPSTVQDFFPQCESWTAPLRSYLILSCHLLTFLLPHTFSQLYLLNLSEALGHLEMKFLVLLHSAGYSRCSSALDNMDRPHLHHFSSLQVAFFKVCDLDQVASAWLGAHQEAKWSELQGEEVRSPL